ncbi:DNA primase family protein, partial [Corynebacterium auriscanis]|uniref:DNA primase family protein n=1 Tax=Corynebacterium auriscanis TaxID=99807 RepID=UPI002248012F
LELDEAYNTYPAPGRAMDVARRLGADLFTHHDGVPTLRFWRGTWWTYTGQHWEEYDMDEVKQKVWHRLDKVTYVKGGEDAKGEKTHVEWLPTQYKVAGALEPLKMNHLVPSRVETPVWTGRGDAPGQSLISMGNGLFDITTRTLHNHTPHWFTTWSLPFDYDPGAQCPTWRKWLDQVFAHDRNAEQAAQEFVGYLLTGRKDIQKGLLLVGVPRGGKSTFNGVVTALMGGTQNVSAPGLDELSDKFGLEHSVGKPLMILGDARNAANGNNKAVERLLQIIGNDSLAVQRKNKPDWVGVLPARVMISTNEVPKFVDSSGAIATRFVAIYLKRSFEGAEDRTMPAKLRAELPGIFLWALEGLQRLEKNNNRFTVPDTQAELLESVREQAAPVRTFLETAYEVTHNESDFVLRSEVYRDYKGWCADNGYHARSQGSMAEAINAAAVVGVRCTQPRDPNDPKKKAPRRVTGIRKTNFF